MAVARFIASQEEVRRNAVGFIGYGSTKPGDRVLLAVTSFYEPSVYKAITQALRKRGARVDVIVIDVGPDRDITQRDELHNLLARGPWEKNPRLWDKRAWVEGLALKNGYDLLIHGRGGNIPKTPHRYESIPWIQEEAFRQRATVFPRDVHVLINLRLWDMIRNRGRGGRVHLTNPEGTDITWTEV